MLLHLWNWARANDLPNWAIFLFTAILWPVALFCWQRKRRNKIPGLEIKITPSQIVIGPKPHPAIAIDFINHTGSVVYVTNARIRKTTSRFPIPPDATRDISGGGYSLAFLAVGGLFTDRETTIQTNAEGKTCMAYVPPLEPAFYTYRPGWFSRVVRWRQYFLLEYTALVGTKRYFVATLY